MNPFDLDVTALLLWGIVAHLVADWPFQNDWMANNKAKRGSSGRVWSRHPGAWVHAGIHGAFLAFVFGWVAVPLALVHLVIDTRVPVVWWSKLVRQTQPQALVKTPQLIAPVGSLPNAVTAEPGRIIEYTPAGGRVPQWAPTYDVGTEVRFWTDQVFHIVCVAVAALIVGGLS